jgi:hypothetical protein
MKVVLLFIALLYSISIVFAQTPDEPNFKIPLKSGGIVFTWSQPENRTLFACGGADSTQKEIIRGFTFTFRAGSPKSIEPACNYWANSVARIISGKDIKDKKWNPEVSYDQGGHYSAIEVITLEGDVINSPIYYRNYLSSSGSRYGSYLSSIRQKKLLSADINYFSQGVFGPPLKNIPKDGSATYSVLLSSSPYTKRLSAVQINFSKAELTVAGQFVEEGNGVQLYTTEPIKINDDGSFMGEIALSLRNSALASNVKAYLAGFLGGGKWRDHLCFSDTRFVAT